MADQRRKCSYKPCHCVDNCIRPGLPAARNYSDARSNLLVGWIWQPAWKLKEASITNLRHFASSDQSIQLPHCCGPLNHPTQCCCQESHSRALSSTIVITVHKGHQLRCPTRYGQEVCKHSTHYAAACCCCNLHSTLLAELPFKPSYSCWLLEPNML
jgi:hypothetical protein